MPVRKRGGIWWVDLSFRGRPRIRESAGRGATREQALEFEAKIRADHHAGRVGRAASHTVSEGFARWLRGEALALDSYRNLLSKANAWTPHLKGRQLREAADVAKDGREAWLKKGLAIGTINRRLAALRRVLKLSFEEWGWLDRPVKIGLLPGEQPRMVKASQGDIRKLLQHCPPRTAKAVLLAASTGLREGELLALVKSNYRGGKIVVGPTKRGRVRSIPLTPVARLIAQRLPLGLTYSQLRRDFEAARSAAGMPWLQFRDLRRTFGSWIVQRTKSLKAAQDLLGHTTITITARHYAHLLDEHLEEAIGRLPKLPGWRNR